MFDETRSYLERVGLPAGDLGALPSSAAGFADGGQYKWEVAGAVGARAAAALIEGIDSIGLHLNQLTHTEGIMRLTDAEIRELVDVVAAADRQLVMAVGPRGIWDIGAQKLAPSPVAAVSAYRLRGMEQVVRAVEDVKRAVALGVRGFLMFDEGLLWLLDRMRSDGELPAELRLKASSGLGVCNPVHCRVIEGLGADSINLQRDVELSMLAASRAAVSVPFDVHTDNPRSTGGFIRTYELPEIVRIGAPVYLKTGNSAQTVFDAELGEREIAGIVHQIQVESEMLARHAPELRQSLVREH